MAKTLLSILPARGDYSGALAALNEPDQPAQAARPDRAGIRETAISALNAAGFEDAGYNTNKSPTRYYFTRDGYRYGVEFYDEPAPAVVHDTMNGDEVPLCPRCDEYAPRCICGGGIGEATINDMYEARKLSEHLQPQIQAWISGGRLCMGTAPRVSE
jgi:hypothetical protein